jgi:hypothetical protein
MVHYGPWILHGACTALTKLEDISSDILEDALSASKSYTETPLKELMSPKESGSFGTLEEDEDDDDDGDGYEGICTLYRTDCNLHLLFQCKFHQL